MSLQQLCVLTSGHNYSTYNLLKDTHTDTDGVGKSWHVDCSAIKVMD